MINYAKRHRDITQEVANSLNNILKELQTSYAKTFSITYKVTNLYSHQNISYVSLSDLNLNSLYVDIWVNLCLVFNSEFEPTVTLKQSYRIENNFDYDNETTDIKVVFKNDINKYCRDILDDLIKSIKHQTQKILNMCNSEDFYNLRRDTILEDVHKLIYDINKIKSDIIQ